MIPLTVWTGLLDYSWGYHSLEVHIGVGIWIDIESKVYQQSRIDGFLPVPLSKHIEPEVKDPVCSGQRHSYAIVVEPRLEPFPTS